MRAACVDGTFAQQSSLRCLVCNSECLTCVDQASKCTACGRVNGVDLFLINNTCISVCPAGMYRNTSTTACEPCFPGCALCTGPTNRDCQACKQHSNGDDYFKVVGEDSCV